MSQILIFAAISIPLVIVSWGPLRAVGSHGFYRFFAWEVILALIVFNGRFWFHDPFSWHQLVSWTLLIIGLVPLGLGVRALRTSGRPVSEREGDRSLLAFEKTSALVTTGIYKYLRHPLYSSLLFLAWGVFFKSPSWLGSLLGIVASILLLATARADERECISFFGNEYREYMNRTKMFIPSIL